MRIAPESREERETAPLLFRPANIISAAITAAARQVVWKVAPLAGSKNRKFLFALLSQPMDVSCGPSPHESPRDISQSLGADHELRPSCDITATIGVKSSGIQLVNILSYLPAVNFPLMVCRYGRQGVPAATGRMGLLSHWREKSSLCALFLTNLDGD